MNLSSNESLIELCKNYDWEFTNNWDLLFPFKSDNSESMDKSNYPTD